MVNDYLFLFCKTCLQLFPLGCKCSTSTYSKGGKPDVFIPNQHKMRVWNVYLVYCIINNSYWLEVAKKLSPLKYNLPFVSLPSFHKIQKRAKAFYHFVLNNHWSQFKIKYPSSIYRSCIIALYHLLFSSPYLLVINQCCKSR